MPTINGTKGAYLQPPRYGFNESGYYSHFRWEGTRSEVLAQISHVESAGGYWEIQEDPTGGKCVLEAQIPNSSTIPEAPQNEWEFFANEIEKDPLIANVAEVAALTAEELGKLIAYRDLKTVPTGLTGTAQKIYKMLEKGVTAHIDFQPVIRHTQIVSNRWAVPASLSYVGRIISRSNMYAAEGVPGYVLFQLPNETSVHADFVYGWLKKFPTIRMAARAKIAIEQEWVYGLWSTVIYGALV